MIGVGNAFRGDDAAGIEVARRLAALPRKVTVTEYEGEAVGLLDLWSGADAVVLVDTIRTGAPAGTVQRFDASAARLPTELRHGSSHTLDLADAIELSRALGTLPSTVVVYGVEGCRFDAGARLSSKVSGALADLVSRVGEEAAALT